MLNYTRIIGTTSNKRVPTLPEIQQGNVSLTPYETAKNNGFLFEMSDQIGKISTELTNLLTARGITPSAGDLTQVLQAISQFSLNKRIICSNNTTDATNDIDFAAGDFVSSDGTIKVSAPASTGQLDVLFDGANGMLDTGSKTANTWYHLYKIYNPTTQTVKNLASTGYPTPTVLPSGYTKYTRVWSVRTSASNVIRPFYQIGVFCGWKDKTQDLNLTSTAASRTNFTLTTPLGVETIAQIRAGLYFNGANDLTVNFLALDDNNVIPISGNGNGYDADIGSETNFSGTIEKLIKTNLLSQISYTPSRSDTCLLSVRIMGYYDVNL